MKKLVVFTGMFFLTLFGFRGQAVMGQVVAIGHATAEVIESISASSSGMVSFELPTDMSVLNQTKSASISMTTKGVEMGTIKIYSGDHRNFSVMVKQASVKNSIGDQLAFETKARPATGHGFVTTSSGQQTIQLSAPTPVAGTQAAGDYSGNVNVIVAYD